MDEDTPTRRVEPDYPTAVHLLPGAKVFGRYELRSLLGKGGMGVVWRAHDSDLDREVALKFILEAVAADKEAVRDLKRETKRCLDLTHANIVRVYDFVQDAQHAAIAMEFVEGQSLSSRKAESPEGCLNVTELAPLVAQLCAALDYAHLRAKIAHRDLKPANLLVTSDGELKVTDFGIARSLSETATRLTGRASDSSGTLPFMSPQQVRGEKPTASDDIYALGATLYDLLAGKPPFFRGDLFNLILQMAPPSPTERRKELEFTGEPIPPQWENTILACLVKDPKGRPQSVGEVAARLGLSVAVSSHASVPRQSPDERPTVREVPETKVKTSAPKSNRSLMAALVALVLVVLGGGYYFLIVVPARQADVARQAEAAHQVEAARQAEVARQAEAAHQAEIARQNEATRRLIEREAADTVSRAKDTARPSDSPKPTDLDSAYQKYIDDWNKAYNEAAEAAKKRNGMK